MYLECELLVLGSEYTDFYSLSDNEIEGIDLQRLDCSSTFSTTMISFMITASKNQTESLNTIILFLTVYVYDNWSLDLDRHDNALLTSNSNKRKLLYYLLLEVPVIE